MNPRERREIIDELAGVAAFDRKIVQTKETLDEVKDREDRCRIVEKELLPSAIACPKTASKLKNTKSYEPNFNKRLRKSC